MEGRLSFVNLPCKMGVDVLFTGRQTVGLEHPVFKVVQMRSTGN